jgi:hypothetical protein
MGLLDRWKAGDPAIIRAPKPTIFCVTEDDRIVNERLEDHTDEDVRELIRLCQKHLKRPTR